MSLHCIVWCCRVLYCWLRRAGCISQDTYLLYVYFRFVWLFWAYYWFSFIFWMYLVWFKTQEPPLPPSSPFGTLSEVLHSETVWKMKKVWNWMLYLYYNGDFLLSEAVVFHSVSNCSRSLRNNIGSKQKDRVAGFNSYWCIFQYCIVFNSLHLTHCIASCCIALHRAAHVRTWLHLLIWGLDYTCSYEDHHVCLFGSVCDTEGGTFWGRNKIKSIHGSVLPGMTPIWR